MACEHDNPAPCATKAGCSDHWHCWWCGVLLPGDVPGECETCEKAGCSQRELLKGRV